MKLVLIGMAVQAFVTTGSYMIGFGDSFGRQITCGMIFLFCAGLLSWRKQSSNVRTS